MSEIPKRYEYFLSPDGLRKLTQLMKSHFDSYTKKDMMYNDSKGLQYNGSVYNFGSEILLETNKLRMTRPPVRNLTYGKDTTFYFNIKYSDLTNTYDQQNMLVCVIKKDTLVASHTYRIKFNNVVPVYVVRSTNTSAGNVVTPSSQMKVQQSYVQRDLFYKTNDFPIMEETYIDENDEVITINHTLKIKDNDTFPTFYFHYNDLTENLIDSIEDGVLTTVELTDSMCDLPVIWFTVKSFEYLKDYVLEDNEDTDGNPILTFGIDGNGVCRLYPNCYNSELDHELKWWLKVIPKDGSRFLPDDEPGDHDANYNVLVGGIELIYNDTVNGTMNENGFCINIIIPDDMILYIDKCQTWGYSNWSFNRMTSDDWDWDSIYYRNPNYGYHLYDTDDRMFIMQSFACNHEGLSNLRPGFKVIFKNEYLYEWETDLIKSVSGIHVDSTDERSNNGVIERNGVSHNLGEFSGLPTYMKIQLDEKVHRSHLEVYAIRDHNNMYNQKVDEKQTAGLILDSGIPQNQLPEILDNVPHIVYDDINKKYTTIDPETIISDNNVLSNIVFVDNKDNEFSDYTTRGMKKYARFFYHGSNYFSLSVIELDPETEYGRAYVISNDPSYYENNYTCDMVKPNRTIGRICDIPTSMLQLANIPDYAPTVLIDWNDSEISYVRTWCNFSYDDKDRIENCPYDKLIVGEHIIFDKDYNLDNLLATTGDRYKRKENLNESITLTFVDGNAEMVVDQGGSGYEIGDVFKFNIGGRYYNGTVDDVGSSGSVINISTDDTFDSINVNNLKQTSTYNTTTIEGSGSGLVIRITIDQTTWDDAQPYVTDDYLDNLFVFKYDPYGHVWIWTYDSYANTWSQHIQVTGTNIDANSYDMSDTDKRKMVDTYMMNMLNNNRKLYDETFTTKPDAYNNISSITIPTDIPKSEVTMEDISDILDDCHINYQNSYYLPIVNNDTVSVKRFTRYPYDKQNTRVGSYHETILPRYNTLNLPNWFNTSNRIGYSIMRDRLHSQPSMYYYNSQETTCTTYDVVSSDYCSINTQHPLTYCDIMEDSLSISGDYFNAPENIYRYDEYSSSSLTEQRYLLSIMNRDQLLVYIRNTFGENAYPLTVETTNPFTFNMLIDYCLTVPQNPYAKSNIKCIAQKGTTVAKTVELEDGSTTILPTNSEQPTGMFESLTDEIHDLNYDTSLSDIDTDILFVFTVPKNVSLVDLRHFHIKDENNKDISKNSILIYDGKCYTFDSIRDMWYEKI